MLKFIGSILIITATTCIGFSKSNEMQRHLHELEELKKLFCLLRSELQYTHSPFAEVFYKISTKTSSSYKEWLSNLGQKLMNKTRGSFWEIWCLSITEDLYETNLKEDELEELKNVGKNMEYIESLDLFIEQLEYRIKNTREVYRSKRKLCQSMGIMGGIFLVILLL
jgi:stage III sporulation protein AB